MKPINQSTPTNIDERYRIMLVLWFGMLSAVGLYFVVAQFTKPPEVDSSQNNTLSIILLVVGVFMVAISFAVKRRFLAQSVERQEPALAQTGLIVALALCEASAILGLVDLMATGHPHYFVVMIVGALGILAHFPRRDHLLAATYKKGLDT